MLNNLLLQIVLVFLLSFFAVPSWSYQSERLDDTAEVPCKAALTKHSDQEEAGTVIDRYRNVSVRKSIKIDSIVNEFSEIRESRSRFLGREYSDREKALAIELVEVLEGNISKAARQLEINMMTLRDWVMAYEDLHGIQIRNTTNQERYSSEYKDDAIELVKELDGNVSEAARQLGIYSKTLRNWAVEYELNNDNGLQIINPLTGIVYSSEEKASAIDSVKELDGNVRGVAKQLGILSPVLVIWVRAHEKKHGVRIRNFENRKLYELYFDEEKVSAIERVIELDGNVGGAARELGIIPKTLRSWVIAHEEKYNVQIRNVRMQGRYSSEYKARAIERVKKLDGNVSKAARQLGIPRSTLRNWVIADKAKK